MGSGKKLQDRRRKWVMRPKTAFVLSGGASLGAVQVGMVRALYERGIEADLIVGTSVGSINGGFLASRPQRPRTAEELAEVWRGIRPAKNFALRALTRIPRSLCGHAPPPPAPRPHPTAPPHPPTPP